MRPLRSSGPDSSERHARLTRATSRASGDRRSSVETASHIRSPPTLPHRLPVRLGLLGRRGDRCPAPAQGPPRGLPCYGSAADRKPPPAAHRPPGRERRLVSDPGPTSSRFDLRASSYEDSVLQEFLFVPVQQAALQLGRRFLPQAGRILDVGCGTGRLLRSARRCYPGAELVGVDLAGRMVAAAIAVTPTRLAVRYVQARAERLPFPDGVFDLVFATLSLRHWASLPAGIAEVARVLSPGGVIVLADIFRNCPRRNPSVPMWRRRRHTLAPAELAAVLAAQRLEVTGAAPARWFGLPDVQVLAASRPWKVA